VDHKRLRENQVAAGQKMYKLAPRRRASEYAGGGK